jgi:hypothetical protein
MPFKSMSGHGHAGLGATSDERPQDGVAGIVAAGAMTFLLSGDLRLALRATRLMIEDNRTLALHPAPGPDLRARRFRRRTHSSRRRSN